VNTAQHEVSQRHPLPFHIRSRLNFNEQLCFFGPGNETGPTHASFGWWAALALGLAAVPWALVALMIWMFA
jgi:hypothetical protein